MDKPNATQTPARAPSTGAASTHEEPNFPAILERMTPPERLRAYRSGAFSRREVSVWTARFPEEVPIVNGEFEWIALDAE